MFYGVFGMVTSKAYDREFLMSNDLLFDMFLQYGIGTDDVQGLCMRDSFFILNSKSITSEERAAREDPEYEADD